MHSSIIAGSQPIQRDDVLPSVHYQKILDAVQRFRNDMPTTNNNNSKGATASSSSATSPSTVALRELIAAAYSSIPVMNASFLLSTSQMHQRRAHGYSGLCIDLTAVRNAYGLLMSTERINPLIVITLGRATLHLAEQLKECPFDDAENLSVFLITLENPLMLRTASNHVAIELVHSLYIIEFSLTMFLQYIQCMLFFTTIILTPISID